MNNILNKLYYGEICPCEKPAPNTKRYIENRELICSTEKKLLEMFPDCKELLDTYTDVLHIEAQLECEADFERGFKLGAQFAAAVSDAIE
ncbi:MAG: hypothetical protein IK990_16665 [Ruminiclostridium sp.]|nr:hypothetical protein [Ruminiclostridium sp.]